MNFTNRQKVSQLLKTLQLFISGLEKTFKKIMKNQVADEVIIYIKIVYNMPWMDNL